MTKIDIKDLSSTLSDYIERARGGEMVVVTDQGELLAELVPLRAATRKLLEMAEAGELSWAGGKPKGLRGVVVRGEPMAATVIKARR